VVERHNNAVRQLSVFSQAAAVFVDTGTAAPVTQCLNCK
jgi:hypothetical protein